MTVVRTVPDPSGSGDVVSLRVADGDWAAFRTMSMWLFHTPPDVVDGIPPGVPAVAATRQQGTSRALAALIADARPVDGG
jgi:cellulose synthase (UDP-forming)